MTESARGETGKNAPVRARGQVDALRGQVSPAMREFLDRAMERIDFESDDEEALWSASAVGNQVEMVGRLIAGRANVELLARLGDQKVSEELRRRNRKRSTFYEHADVFLAYNSLSSAHQIEELAEAGYTKGRLVASMPDDDRSALVDGEEVYGLTLDELKLLPTREVEARFKKWRQEHDLELLEKNKRLAELHYANERLEAEAQTMRDQLAYRAERAKHPPWFTAVRVEGAAQCEAIADAVGQIESLVAQYLTGLAAPSDEEGEQYARMAAGTLYHALAAALARGQVVCRDLIQQHGEDLAAGNDLWSHALDGDELQALAQRRAEVLRSGELDRTVRQHVRAADAEKKRSGPGRPSGSRDKKPRKRRGG